MPEQVHTVAGITAMIRDTLESRFDGVWIEGEISNHRLPGSGHHYFTLKDPFAQLACVFFKGAASRCPVRLADGLQVQVYGNLSVYEARGQYQLVAQLVQGNGFGDLQARFEALKRKLEAEGLFDRDRKKPIPTFPERIGIVTSPTGAAIRDILNVLRRRAPWVRVTIYPTRVQGDGAAEEVAAGIGALDRMPGSLRPDVILLARGGGSIEDLWAFNEEVVARAISACETPVMTGVGHEIDFTIADFVADRREPTPSAAAENAAPDGHALRRHLGRIDEALETRVLHALRLQQRHLDSLRREIAAREPGRKIRSLTQTIDFLVERLDNLTVLQLREGKAALAGAGRAFAGLRPERQLDRWTEESRHAASQLDRIMDRRLEAIEAKVRLVSQIAQSLSPEAVLKRGFSITSDEHGALITRLSQVQPGSRVRTRLMDGEFESAVT